MTSRRRWQAQEPSGEALGVWASTCGWRLARAESELEAAGEDTEKRRVATRDKHRLEQFLKLTSE